MSKSTAAGTLLCLLALSSAGCIASEAVLDGVFVGISDTVAGFVEEKLLGLMESRS